MNVDPKLHNSCNQPVWTDKIQSLTQWDRWWWCCSSVVFCQAPAVTLALWTKSAHLCCPRQSGILCLKVNMFFSIVHISTKSFLSVWNEAVWRNMVSRHRVRPLLLLLLQWERHRNFLCRILLMLLWMKMGKDEILTMLKEIHIQTIQ